MKNEPGTGTRNNPFGTKGALIHPCGRVRASSQSPLASVSALRRKLRPLPCSSFPRKTGFAGGPCRAYLRTGNFPRAPIWRLCRNKGLHPLRRLRGYPCTPTKTVHPPLAVLYHFCGFYYPIREVIPIAIYHCSIGIVSRGKGKSAVAAAAYRSGEKITNEWDGMTHDYTRKGGVVHTEILLPPNAPPSFSDRSNLVEQRGALREKPGTPSLPERLTQ